MQPIGLVHLQEFTQDIMGMAEKLNQIELPAAPDKMPEDEETRAKVEQALEATRNGLILRALAPVLLTRGLDLVAACTTIESNEWSLRPEEGKQPIPHWDIAPIVEAFVLENRAAAAVG